MASGTQTALILPETGKPLIRTTIPIEQIDSTVTAANANANDEKDYGERIQIKVAATGLIPADYKFRTMNIPGMGFSLPYILGCEISGTVVSSPSPSPSSSSSKYYPPGTRIGTLASFTNGKINGGLQEYTTAYADWVFRIPDHITDEQAATLACNPFVGGVALFDPVFGFGIPLPQRETSASSFSSSPESEKFDYASTKIVIIGGTSITKYAVQQARIAGIGTIICIASPKTNRELLDVYGATHVVDRGLPLEEIVAAVRGIVGGDDGEGEGLRFVFDTYTMGDPVLARALFPSLEKNKKKTKNQYRHQQPGQRILTMASLFGAVDIPALTAKGIIVKGFRAWLGPYDDELQVPIAREWLALFEQWLAEGKIVVPPFKTVPFEAEAVNTALDAIEKAQSGVKFVVKVAS